MPSSCHRHRLLLGFCNDAGRVFSPYTGAYRSQGFTRTNISKGRNAAQWFRDSVIGDRRGIADDESAAYVAQGEEATGRKTPAWVASIASSASLVTPATSRCPPSGPCGRRRALSAGLSRRCTGRPPTIHRARHLAVREPLEGRGMSARSSAAWAPRGPWGPGSGRLDGAAQPVHRAQSCRSDHRARAAVERLMASTPQAVDR